MKLVLSLLFFFPGISAPQAMADEHSVNAKSGQVSVHCELDDGVVFTYLRVTKGKVTDDFIFRRPWGRRYCQWMQGRIQALLRTGVTVEIRGEGRSRGPSIAKQGKNYYSYFISIKSNRGVCVSYFEGDCRR